MPTITLHHCEEYLVYGTDPPAGDATAAGTKIELQNDDATLGNGTVTVKTHGCLLPTSPALWRAE